MPLFLTDYDDSTGPAELGELWALTKDSQRLRLIVQTHPEGWSLCLCRNGDVLRRDHVRRRARVILLAARWRANAEQAGWCLLRADEVHGRTDSDGPGRRRIRGLASNR
jgi:hypothetical protein